MSELQRLLIEENGKTVEIFVEVSGKQNLDYQGLTNTLANRPVGKQKQCLEQILLFPSVFKKRPNRSSISQPHST